MWLKVLLFVVVIMAVASFSVLKEYEKQNVKEEDIKQLLGWLNKQEHLPWQYISELDVILAHHSCYCDVEVTRKVLDLNFTLRTIFKFYQNREVDQSLEFALQTWLITPLPTLTKQGYSAIYCQLLDVDTKKFVYGDVIRLFLMVLDLWQYEHGTVPGVVIIVNCDNVSLGHISRVNLTIAQQFFYFLQEAMFVRLKEFHFINAPTFIDHLLAMVRHFMKDELIEILKVHTVNSNTLDQYISKEALPIEAGGNYIKVATLKDEVCHRIKANQTFYKEESRKRVDESKRPGGPKTLSSFFPGMEDTFKNLAID